MPVIVAISRNKNENSCCWLSYLVAGITWAILQCYVLNSSNQRFKQILLSLSHRQAREAEVREESCPGHRAAEEGKQDKRPGRPGSHPVDLTTSSC